MASNKELIKTITALTASLGAPVINTDGMTNAGLNEIAKALRAQLDEQAAPKAEIKAEIKDEPAKIVAANDYVVAPGKSLTTLRGVLSAGAPIEARFLSDGAGAFAALQAKKYIVKA